MKIETKFDLREKVKIPALAGIEGLILNIEFHRHGIDYDVRWFNNGELKSAWFMEDELEKVGE